MPKNLLFGFLINQLDIYSESCTYEKQNKLEDFDSCGKKSMELKLNILLQNYGLQQIAFNICSFLNLKDLLKCKTLSKEWNHFIEQNKPIWKLQTQSFKFGIMKNHFDINEVEVYPNREIDFHSKDIDVPFLKKFPTWKKKYSNT